VPVDFSSVDNSDFDDGSIGSLIPINGIDPRFGEFDAFAYLPHPLPTDDEITLNNRAWAAVSKAEEMLGRLDQECGHMTNASLLIRPALLREAMDTSALEGTFGVLTDILEAQYPDSGPLSPETREIRAFEAAAMHAFEEVKLRPISVGLLCGIQAEIFKDSDEQPRDIGEIRKHQVFIGPKHRPITEARFIPPPGDDRLKSGLETLIDWTQSESGLPLVLRVTLAHYQFETLHPFGDGNGRVGRLLVILQLMEGKSIREPAITLSPWLLPRRNQYQDELLNVSRTGDWSPWVIFFCEAISHQCQSLIDGARNLTDWKTRTYETVRRNHWSGLILQVVDDLAEWPLVTIPGIAEKHHVTYPAAKSAVERLVTIGSIREITLRKYNRVFVADEVIAIVEAI